MNLKQLKIVREYTYKCERESMRTSRHDGLIVDKISSNWRIRLAGRNSRNRVRLNRCRGKVENVPG